MFIKKKNQQEKDLTNQPDEDGWITVTPKSRKANKSALTERNIEKLKMKQKKKQQKMQLVSFYKFQAQNTKNDCKCSFFFVSNIFIRCSLNFILVIDILQLRKKFEEDKNQIEEMKKQRKFKPF